MIQINQKLPQCKKKINIQKKKIYTNFFFEFQRSPHFDLEFTELEELFACVLCANGSILGYPTSKKKR